MNIRWFIMVILLTATIYAEDVTFNVTASIDDVVAILADTKTHSNRPILVVFHPMVTINGAKSIDYNTIHVKTGVINGPLNGGGKIVIFHKVNGSWVYKSWMEWVS